MKSPRMSILRSLAIVLVLLTVSCQRSPQSTPAGQLMPTTALVATSTGVLPSATEPALSIFQAPDGCLPDVFFQVSYDDEQWSLHEDRLSHRQQSECSLWLIPSSTEVSPPMQPGVATLSGQVWDTRHFPTEGLISYLPRRDGVCYFFIVYYPKGASDETLAACRQAAETVIDTFELVSSP